MAKKRAVFLLLALVLSLFITSFTLVVFADTSIPKTSIGYHVKAIIPNNQRDKSKSYFDLRMRPNQEQEIQVQIENVLSEEITVNVDVNSGYTSIVGNIDYKLPNVRDTSLSVAIEDIASLPQKEFQIAPKETITVPIKLKMPEKSFDGEILGGILVQKKLDPIKNEIENSGIRNTYSYVIGLVLTETDVVVSPELELQDVYVDIVNYRTAVVHEIRNIEPVILKNTNMDINVYQKGVDTPIWSNYLEELKMAPSSLMKYTFYLDNEVLEPGEYISIVHIYNENQEWEFEKSFQISGKKAKETNQNSVTIDEKTNKIPIQVLIFVIVLLIVIFILLLFIIYRLIKGKNSTENE